MSIASPPNQDAVDRLHELFRQHLENEPERLVQPLKEYHPADIAEALSDYPNDWHHPLLRQMDPGLQAEVLNLMSDVDEDAIEDFLEEAPVAQLVDVIEEMNPDDAADLLASAEPEKAEAVLRSVESEHAEDVRQLRQYDPETAGGIMTTEFLWVQPTDTKLDIIKKLRVEEDEIEEGSDVYVCNQQKRLLGSIALHHILAAKPSTEAASMMDKAVVQVVPQTDQEVCAYLMMKYNIVSLPVVDQNQRLVGLISHDDIMDVLDDEAQEDMYRLAGVGDDRPLEHGPFERAFKRLPWLATTLIGMGLLGPVLLHNLFHGILEQVVTLALFIPAIMGIAGNTAMQSSTITVRGLATGELEHKDLMWMLRRETCVAAIIAVVCACTITLFSFTITKLGSYEASSGVSMGLLSLTVGISMFISVMFAVMVGTTIPMICQRFHIDPAVAAGPFITTIIDISSQLIYLGLATWLLVSLST